MTPFEPLSGHRPGIMGLERYRKYAVMILLLETGQGYQVLLQVRSSNLRHQPGEICLPGGKIEAGESPLEAAMRETEEELLVKRFQIKLLAEMDLFLSPANVMIYPFLALLNDYQGTYNPSEVQEVFQISLDELLQKQPKAYRLRVTTQPGPDFPFALIPGGRDYIFQEGDYQIDFYRFGQHVIWGMTARILGSLSQLFQTYQIILPDPS